MATVDIPEDQPIEVTVGAPTFVTGVGGIDGITEARAVELDAQTLAAAKAYADEIDTVPLEYVDDGDADAVAQAKAYTDTALVEVTAHAESYTDDAIAGIDFPDTGVPEATIDAKDQAVREHADAGDQSIRELIASLPAPVTNWSGITGKPSTFTPAAHTHTVSQITDMPATPTWGTLGGKPTTFPPSAHQHTASDITSGTFEVARLGTGTAGAGKALFGDGTWKDAPTGGSAGAWYDSGPRNLATALAIRVQRIDGTVTVAANNGAGAYSPGSANNGILPAGTLPVGMRPKYAENTFIFSASPANTPFIFRVNPDGSISVHSYGPNITISYGACTLSFAPASLAIPASLPGTPG